MCALSSRGEGGKALVAGPLKITFFDALKTPQKILPKNVATKLEEGGGKALVAGPLKKLLLCGFPYRIQA